MRGDKADGRPSTETIGESSDRALWRRSVATDTVEDEGERFLDLAGFAEDRLDPEERERIAERLGRDPVAAADVAAARALAGGVAPDRAPARVISRASALVTNPLPKRGLLIHFPRPRWPQPTLPGIARWASLAAALLVASWLGFDLGSTTSAAFGPVAQPAEDSPLRDLIEPSTGFVRDLSEGVRT